jgi:hypothetical protein
VGRELVERFAASFPGAEVSPDGIRLDLAAVLRHQLRSAGLAEEAIEDCGACTFADPSRFHSYRRDGGRAGQLLTIIGAL